MTTLDHDAAAVTSRRLRSQEDVEAHIRAICFKTGPPARVGAELEWTLHHAAAPDAPLDAATVRHALGRHAPAVLDPTNDPPDPLPGDARLTMEPGGQLEISSAPAASLAELHTAVSAGLGHLTALLGAAGLALGAHGIDPHRPPRRLLHTPRYAAMERVFDARGRDGRTMMCSTAGLQVCLDAGPAGEIPLRWRAVHEAGPPLIALFANSRRHAGRDTGLASARMAAWWAMDRRLTHPPVGPPGDPAATWARYALAAPLLCLRRDGECWDPPPGLTLCDWVHGALPSAPTADDVDYHLSTLFPPVRPRGYLEVRYLDCQPGADWIVPVAVVAALLADKPAAEAVLEVTAPVAGRWPEAYRLGLADRPLRRAAEALAHLALSRLDPALPGAVREHVIATVHRRLRDATATSAAEEPR
ncbi:ergothioneine biosynthesis glutamate--cysteine ligase EgtA [Actinoplanes rishiriensis]|uniref:Glutamate--cysteine ligase EgtA n=1 Tax=Paractinoplanes rishiriensis TaxID=1050105 RepID=A0A919K4V3_9ACTN|nr:glutamate--cysteine ligase EgtA [Actinoplanes rishiriensis]